MSFSLVKFYIGFIILSSALIVSLMLEGTAYALPPSSEITPNEQLTDHQDSIFLQAAKSSQYNTFRDIAHNFSFTPPAGWTQGTSGQTAFFTRDSGGTLGTLGLDYVEGSPLPESIFSIPDETVLNAVANNMLNSSQPIIEKNMQKFSDGFKFKVIYETQVSQNISTKSEQILFWLKDGRQYYFSLVCDEYNFNQNSADFENAINTFYAPSTQSNQQTSQPTHIPGWIKNNAKWWSEGTLNDDDFIKGVQYLIQDGIMKIPPSNSAGVSSHQIPVWVKNNAGWWSSGQISDDDFVKGMQYLATNGIIKT